MTPIELLDAAQELIRDPKRWTQGTPARNSQGVQVHERDESAVCWCAIGAIWKVGGMFSGVTEEVCSAINACHTKPGGIGGFNDRKKHAEVMALFDKARERLASSTPAVMTTRGDHE